jgi:hypothetical protein
MLKELEQFKTELAEDIKSHLDSAVQEKVQTLIGDERAAIVREAVESMRLEKAVLGHDKTGLTDAQKSDFAKFVKNVALQTKANEALIGEQDTRGGYLVPSEVANAILRIAATVGVAMSQCARWDMKGDELDIPSYGGSFLEGEYLGVDAAGGVTGITFKSAKLIAKSWQLAFVVGRDLLAEATPAVGKHVDAVQTGKSILNVKNLARLGWGSGPTYSVYSDATSQNAYGHRDTALSDSGIQNSGSADAKGNGEIARLKDPKTKTLVTVNANYAIETILPGDTLKILNVPSGSSSLLSGQVLRIQRVEYDGSLAVLHLADITDVFGSEL